MIVLFDSQKDAVSGKKIGFWQYFGFSGGKLDQNGPKPSTLGTSCFQLNT